MYVKPLISICIPTFRRVERCKTAIRSIVDACDDPANIEICLRVQHGDVGSMEAIPAFVALAPVVRIVVGLTYGGYKNHHLFFNDVIRISDGKWIWMIDDDSTVSRWENGAGLDTIMSAQEPNAIVLPRRYHLNESGYDYCSDTPAIFMPTQWWTENQLAAAGSPLDRAVFGTLRKKGIPTRFIDIEYHHHHDSPDAWRAHKAGVV